MEKLRQEKKRTWYGHTSRLRTGLQAWIQLFGLSISFEIIYDFYQRMLSLCFTSATVCSCPFRQLSFQSLIFTSWTEQECRHLGLIMDLVQYSPDCKPLKAQIIFSFATWRHTSQRLREKTSIFRPGWIHISVLLVKIHISLGKSLNISAH